MRVMRAPYRRLLTLTAAALLGVTLGVTPAAQAVPPAQQLPATAIAPAPGAATDLEAS